MRQETNERGYELWYPFHPRCALERSSDDVAEALRRSTLAFEGRAELEAEVHERIARRRAPPASFESAVARQGAVTAAALATESMLASRPVDPIAIVMHEQWAAGRMQQSLREALGGLLLRSNKRNYGLAMFGDELPDVDVIELQRRARAFVLFVPTSGSTMPPMKRALWGIRNSGVRVAALWLVGDAPTPSPARDRREQEAREALDAVGIDADSPPVVHAQRADASALAALGEALDVVFEDGIPPPKHPADIAVETFEWFAAERKWQEAFRALETAIRRDGNAKPRPSLVRAALRALELDELSMLPLQILARAKDPATSDALWAFLQTIWQPGSSPGTMVVFVCELLAELGDTRCEAVAWDGYRNAVGTLREDLEAMLAKFGGGDLLLAITRRIAATTDPEQREVLEEMHAKVKRRVKRRGA